MVQLFLLLLFNYFALRRLSGHCHLKFIHGSCSPIFFSSFFADRFSCPVLCAQFCCNRELICFPFSFMFCSSPMIKWFFGQVFFNNHFFHYFFLGTVYFAALVYIVVDFFLLQLSFNFISVFIDFIICQPEKQILLTFGRLIVLFAWQCFYYTSQYYYYALKTDLTLCSCCVCTKCGMEYL